MTSSVSMYSGTSRYSGTSCRSKVLVAMGTVCLMVAFYCDTELAQSTETTINVRLSFGHRTPKRLSRYVKLLPGAPGVTVSKASGMDLEADDRLEDSAELHVGAGDVDSLECDIQWVAATQDSRKPHEIWTYHLENTTPKSAERLREDPGLVPDAPVLTVMLAKDGTHGFSVGLDQLRKHGAMWLPDHDAYITLADTPVLFSAHLDSLQGERVLDRVKREPEATLEDFTARWEDMGNPDSWNKSWETEWLGTRGHIVGTVGTHGSVYKFGIDRHGNVRPDFASPHQFRFDLSWPGAQWAGQQLTNGLPVLITRYARKGQHCKIEQFAAPLASTSSSERGKQPMVLFTKATLSGAAGPISLRFRLSNGTPEDKLQIKKDGNLWSVVDRQSGSLWLTVESDAGSLLQKVVETSDKSGSTIAFEITFKLTAGKSSEVVLKLPSPSVPAGNNAALTATDFSESRTSTLKYWEDWLLRGARFEVPEARVNSLFRANIWHALRLPRYRTEKGQNRIDLPYSNYAYGQLNADWPINQAVYVDYMIYGLRGLFDIADEEFEAMFQSQQQTDGMIAGFANWGVYTPSMLYSVSQNFLLSQDRKSFESLLPQSLRAMDWCLEQTAAAQNHEEAPGLIIAPLNDLTKDRRAWAFTQAYFSAGLDSFGRALEVYGHPRATECRAAAEKMKLSIEREFSKGSVKSPVVQLEDGTWCNYVPCDALTPRRLIDVWYPTDVDTGPLHLSRLSAVNPRGWLTTAMLNDHEDNLFLKQWGAANEPIYNQQGMAYLLRDEPKLAIRTFYSMMACAFSHSQWEPVEHRWAWSQYFGPPSTDGAWFELYRKMLIHEIDNETLFLGQATPRAWLQEGKHIDIERAPTYFGPINFHTHGAANEIHAQVKFGSKRRPELLLVRLRHPGKKQIRSVTVNGEEWKHFDAAKEWIRIESPTLPNYHVITKY